SIIVAAGELMDVAGNPTPLASREIVVSERDPSDRPDRDTPLAGIYVNGSAALTAFEVAGTAGNNAAITVTITDEDGGTAGGTDAAEGAGDGDWSANINIMPLADGELTILVSASETGKAANQREIMVMKDTMAPTVSMIAGATTATVGDTVMLTITLSEGSSTFAENDITVANSSGTLDNFTESSSTIYTVEFTATTTTSIGGISVAAGTFTDAAGNNNTGTATHTINVTPVPDSAAPTIDAPDVVNLANQSGYSLSGTATTGAAVSVTIADTDTTTDDVVGSDTAQSGRWTISGLDLSGLMGEELTIIVTASEANSIPASATARTTKDTSAPSITEIAAVPMTIATGDTATITFTFDEAPSGFVDTDIVANGGSISGLTTSGLVRTATFTADTLPVTAIITVGTSAYTDAAGNANAAPSSVTVTIVGESDSRMPMLTLDDASNSGADNDTITNDTSPTLTVGNLVAGSGLTLTAGHTTTTVTINVASVTGNSESIALGDPNALAEGEWTITATHTETGVGKMPSTSTLTLTIDDTAPTVTLAAASTSIAATGATTITATADEDIIGLAQEDFTVTGGSLSGFGTVEGSSRVYRVTFTANNSTTSPVTASIAIKADSYTDIAANAGAAGTAISIAVAAVDATYTLNNASEFEGDALEFVLTSSHDVTGSDKTFTYEITYDGRDNPADDDDFVSGGTGGSAMIAVGQKSATFTVRTRDDDNDEYNETFVFEVSEGATSISAVIGAINNNDNPPTMTVTTPDVIEGNMEGNHLVFAAFLSPISGKTVTVDYETITSGTATAGADYTSIMMGTLTFVPGRISLPVTVTVIDDMAHEIDETVTLRFSNPMNLATTGFTSMMMDVTGTIEDNEAGPMVSVSDASASEGDGAVFTVTLSVPSEQIITVRYATAPDTSPPADASQAGADDYDVNASGNITFMSGETTAMFTVSTTGDNNYELKETFLVNISIAGGEDVTAGDVLGRGSILNDDGLPSLTYRIAPDDNRYSEPEGTALVFTVTRIVPGLGGETVSYELDYSSQTNPADNDDFVSGDTSGSAVIPVGRSTATFTVRTIDDDDFEQDE
ncbi:MAG: Ig-like domain-containing protein, partial [Pseudohongiellaceae bacterium]